jgi:hypothetical protein
MTATATRDRLALFLGRRRPAWDTEPPPWAPRRPASWYMRRSQNTAAVVAAAQAAAAADTNPAPER